jgi:hypothetical protein
MEILFTFHDLFLALKQKKRALLLSFFFFGSLSFFFFTCKPIYFTAKGIFKVKNAPSLKSLTGLDKNELLFKQETPITLMKSLPILERVVQKLQLQATLYEQSPSCWKKIYEAIVTEVKLLCLARQRPHSSILSPEIRVASAPLIPKRSSDFVCSDLVFEAEEAQQLRLCFSEGEEFTVFRAKQEIGKGWIGKPFAWEGHSFTLHACKERRSKRPLLLSFIPKMPIAQSLAINLSIKKDKLDGSLFHLQYRHPDCNLAASIVNETMEQFALYSEEMEKNQQLKQFVLLVQRAGELKKEQEREFSWREEYFEGALQEGDLNIYQTLEKQNGLLQQLLSIKGEIQKLGVQIKGSLFATEEEMEAWRAQCKKQAGKRREIEEGKHELLRQLEQLEGKEHQYQEIADYLSAPSETIPLCTALVDHPSLNSSWKKIIEWQHALVDEKNWSEKERESWQAALIVEKEFLKKQILHLLLTLQIERRGLLEHLAHLDEAHLASLIEGYFDLQKELQALQQAARRIAKKASQEERFTLKKEQNAALMQLIDQLIEEQYYRASIANVSFPFQLAKASLIPDPPHLLLGFFLGGIAGLALACLGVLAYELSLTPRVTHKNLPALGFTVCGSFDHPLKRRSLKTLEAALFYLERWEAKNVLLYLEEGDQLVERLSQSFNKLGRKIKFSENFDLAAKEEITLYLTRTLSYLPLLQKKMDATLFCVQRARLRDVLALSSKTLFLFTREISPAPLALLRPALARFLKKRTHQRLVIKP